MRRAISFMLVAVAAIAAGPVEAAEASDWLAVMVTAGPEGATDIELELRVEGTTDGTGPLVYGDAIGTGDDGFIFVDAWGGSGSSIDLSTDLYSHHVDLTEGKPGTFALWSGLGIGGEVDPGAQLLWIAFFAGGALSAPPAVSGSAAVGEVSLTTTLGSGSTSVSLDDANGRSTGAVAHTAAAGVFAHTAEVPAGIVGGAIWTCERCSGTWRAPDSRRGRWSASGYSLVLGGSWSGGGDIGFMGPAGTWEWVHSGAMTTQGSVAFSGEPVMVGYAPVGDLWEWFL